MTSPQPPKTRLTALTKAVQTILAKANFSKLALRPNARVPELWVQDKDAVKADVYPLVGDYYLLGRSSSSSDIVVRNPVVSKVHLALARQGQGRQAPFAIEDRDSSNGIFRGKQRISKARLRHGDVLTLGPPELANGVRLKYVDPPPWYVRGFRWSCCGFAGVSALAALWVLVEWQKFSVRPLPVSVGGPVIVYARDGQTLLRQTRTRGHLEAKSLSGYSPYLINAAIASEDTRFYWHMGIDPIGIARAIVTNLQGGEIREGGSTITQQLARSLFRDYVGTEDSAGRKLREAAAALKLEMFYSKDDLLLAYLNRVFLGLDLYGFEDAAQFYFAKSAKDLTLSEAATLVGILPAPNSFNPVQNYDLAVEYRDRVIYRMRALGSITQEEANQARRSRININPKAIELLSSTIAPYYYSYIFTELEELLGLQLAREGNFIVQTGLDVEIQKKAEAALQAEVDTTGAAVGFTQGAIVTLDATTGEVRAIVGGRDYQESQFNRATQALRQPGSTFKVFAYAAALESGISPGTSYDCSPLTWQGQSFDGCRSGAGALDMYSAMAASENAVALRVARDVGLGEVVNMAKRLGIRSELQAVPGLILGQSEVTLLELTGAFTAFANGGTNTLPHAINKIYDSSDCEVPDNPQTCRCIYSYTPDPVCESTTPTLGQVLSPDVAATMNNLLQGVVSGGTGRSAAIGLGEAGKTGTTNDNVDLWFVGYIPQQLVTGIWLGNDDNSPTQGSSAQAAQLWGEYMGQLVR